MNKQKGGAQSSEARSKRKKQVKNLKASANYPQSVVIQSHNSMNVEKLQEYLRNGIKANKGVMRGLGSQERDTNSIPNSFQAKSN